MSAAWQSVSIGSLLKKSEEVVWPAADARYKEITVRLWGRGVVARGEVEGLQLVGKRRFRARQGQFIASRIDSRNGALGVVPASLDGAIVTNDFPLFDVDSERLDPGFLGWLSRTERFVELCRRASEGTTNRVRLKEERFLALEIALPQVIEQRRIVARIEAISGKMEQALKLRRGADEDARDLLVALAHRRDLADTEKQSRGWVKRKLGECIRLVEDPVTVDAAVAYPNLGIYSFGRGLFAKPPIAGIETSATRLYRVKKGQFIYSRLFAFEGAYGVVTADFDGCFVSNEYPTFECHPDLVLPQFLAAYFRTPAVWRPVATGSKGLGDRRQRVHPEQVLRHEMWVPPLCEQIVLGDVARVCAEARVQIEPVTSECAALLPAVLDRAFSGGLQAI